MQCHAVLCCNAWHMLSFTCCHVQVPTHMVSSSASPQGLAQDSPALHQQSSPRHSHVNASQQSQGPSTRSLSPAGLPTQAAIREGGNESESNAHAQPAAQHAQHAGQGSNAHRGQHRRQGQHLNGQQPYQQHVMVGDKLHPSANPSGLGGFWGGEGKGGFAIGKGQCFTGLARIAEHLRVKDLACVHSKCMHHYTCLYELLKRARKEGP